MAVIETETKYEDNKARLKRVNHKTSNTEVYQLGFCVTRVQTTR